MTDRLLDVARRLTALLRGALDVPVAVRLWDGSLEPLGPVDDDSPVVHVTSPGVLPSLVRRPSLDRLIRHYAHGRIELEGGTLVDLAHAFGARSLGRSLKRIERGSLVRALWPFVLAPGDPPDAARGYAGEISGSGRAVDDNRRYVSFHYDVGNDFYRLFLDPEMQYSCAYYPSWEASLETAQRAKLEMICRKLRLAPGERLLDIGCGWGGLVCHAARHYGVRAHGITLSEEQLAFARDRIRRLGLDGRVTVELRDYRSVEGTFDKIASIGMYEHIGIANIEAYFRRVRRLLADGGLFLNHAISRGAKRKRRRFGSRPEQRALQRYIFPGGELDDIGHTLAEMEKAGFEVHDVEGWRWHYARTTRLWCERLTARRAEAEALVGPETFRIWVAYLGGCAIAFERGSARLFQTVAGRTAKGAPPVPPTRADLYRAPADAAGAPGQAPSAAD